ncbi:hypothetical protein BBJ28_00009923 [Nothophytophthora sp. Chile5]|nr:hypothetical protein BBJ28_00009923 [Nothophytophthora sp. Chile5]
MSVTIHLAFHTPLNARRIAMDATTEIGAAPPPPPRTARAPQQLKKKAPHPPKPPPVSSHRQERPDPPATEPDAASDAADAELRDFRETTWFVVGDGDLAFAQWLLSRCTGVGDVATPQSLDTTRRVYALYQTQRRLRRELSLGSKAATPASHEEESHEEEEEESREAVAEHDALWTVEDIVQQVGDVLKTSRAELLSQQRAAIQANRRFEGGLERVLVAEVVENGTELLLSRAASEHEPLLRRWMELLQEQEQQNEDEAAAKQGEEGEEAPPEEAEAVDGQPKSKKRERKEKKARARKSSARSSEAVACEQVASFLVFLAASTQKQAAVAATLVPPAAEQLWTTELQRIVELSSIEPAEEARRLRVARDIQDVLRREVGKWRHCDVALFGSSLSLYGSRNSDLDMCLIPSGRGKSDNVTPPTEVVGSRQLRHLLHGKAGDGGDAPTNAVERAELLRDLRAQVHKSREKLTQALNGLDRVGKNSEKIAKQRRQWGFFDSQLRLLRDAITAELAVLGVAEEPRSSAAKTAHLKTLVAASKRRNDDLYKLRAVLQRAAKCQVRHVIAGARIPIIRFLHSRSGREYECDLCFENVLATRNTLLLRAYASFDDRARALGLGVKHWAKQRAVSDAAMGFLSSYSFVLLSIYYLQTERVLPNLQDPRLLELAQVPAEDYNGVNIAFCTDRAVARRFHEQVSGSTVSDASVSRLLAGFFEFYATQFDFARRVVTVRDPEKATVKAAQWGARKAKTWRLSIEDPLETARDLGCVLQFKGQEKILRELRRAHELLAAGKSFSSDVCAAEKAPEKAKQDAAESSQRAKRNEEKAAVPHDERRKQQQQHEAKERSFVVTLWSADEELTEATIRKLFKSFEKSFRVGKIDEVAPDEAAEAEVASNANKKWRVELLTMAQKCPRTLAFKTRIDWEAVNGSAGHVWIHQQALYATPPCQKCMSPTHATRSCPPEGPDEGVDDEGAGAGDRGEARKDRGTQSGRKHVLFVSLGGPRAAKTASTRKELGKKQQPHDGPRSADQKAKAKVKPSKKNGKTARDGQRTARQEEAEPEPVVLTSGVLEVVEVAVSSPAPPTKVEGENEKKSVTQKKTKRSWHGTRKRTVPKGGGSNAATT